MSERGGGGFRRPSSDGHPAVIQRNQVRAELEAVAPVLSALNERVTRTTKKRTGDRFGKAPETMGQWVITIHGGGPHHTRELTETDANRLAARFVREALAAGHVISHASVVCGAEDNVMDADAYLSRLDAIVGATPVPDTPKTPPRTL